MEIVNCKLKIENKLQWRRTNLSINNEIQVGKRFV